MQVFFQIVIFSLETDGSGPPRLSNGKRSYGTIHITIEGGVGAKTLISRHLSSNLAEVHLQK